MEDVTYTLFYVYMLEGNSMSTGHYYCDILEFNTGIWWRCDDDNITQLRVISECFYSVAPYPTSGKYNKTNVMKSCDKIFLCYELFQPKISCSLSFSGM